MKYLLFVVAILFQYTNAGTILAAYSGTTAGGATWAPPDTTAACAPQTTNTGVSYAKFNVSFPSAGVYQVKCLFEQSFKSNNPVVLAYSGSAFNPTAPCTSFLANVGNVLGLTGGPVVDDAVYVSAGINTFIVTAETSSGSGIFACQITPPQWGGSTTGSNLYISPVSNNQATACSSSSGGVQAGTFTWTQPATGQYDVNIYFANTTFASSGFGANGAIYAGNRTFAANGTEYDPCAYSPIKSGQLSAGRFAILIQNVTLTAGNTYTALFAGGATSATGYWGATVDPTYVHTTVGSLGTWTEPDQSDANSGTCSNGYANSFIFVYPFIATNPTYIIDTQQLDYGTYLDTFSFLYDGINNASVPSTCSGFLYGGDTGDIRPIAYSGLVPGRPYTVVVSSYSSSASGDFGLFTFSGTQIGTVPTPPTTGAVSGTSVSATSVSATSVSGTSVSATSVSATSVSGTSVSGLATVAATTASSATTAAESGAAELAISALVLLVAAVICF